MMPPDWQNCQGTTAAGAALELAHSVVSMRLGWNSLRLLTLLFVASLLVAGCGSSFRISGALNVPAMSVVAGPVSFVQFTAIFDSSGTLVNVTIVTLATTPTPSTLTFCGNQTSQFTMTHSVQISFNPGTSVCSNLVSVVNRGA
jgi:hypothetical protein